MKHDFVKSLDSYRARQNQFRVLDVPPTQYLMIDGSGDPNTTPAFTDAVATLYPVAYKVKFLSKATGADYVVTPLEGLWWSKDHSVFTSARDKTLWDWTLMMMVPPWITAELVEAARSAASGPPSLELLRFETLEEDRCVQTLHVGSYDNEAETLRRMHDEFIPGDGLRMVGKHHEIYLSDARRTAPSKLRTILRQPVA